MLNHLTENATAMRRFGSFASNKEIITKLYEKINAAVFEADEESKKLSRDQIDNIYLFTATGVSTVAPQQIKGGSNV